MKPEYLTLHKYFLNASRTRSLFLSVLEAGEDYHLHKMIYLDLWYACLYVVVEGWRKEKVNDPTVTALLRDDDMIRLLAGFRNAVFHYDPNYNDARREAVLVSNEFVAWIHSLHEALSEFFLHRS